MLDFPNVPIMDQEFDATPLKRFTWDGERWWRGIIPPKPPTLIELRPRYTELNTATTCSVIGTEFNATTVVNWDGNDIASTFVSTSELTINAPLSAVEKTVSVYVTNTGFPASNGLTFDYWMNSGNVPILVGIAPSQSGPTANFEMILDGFYFAPNTIVLWNGVETGTTVWDGSYRLRNHVNSTTLTSDTYTITVANGSTPGTGSAEFILG